MKAFQKDGNPPVSFSSPKKSSIPCLKASLVCAKFCVAQQRGKEEVCGGGPSWVLVPHRCEIQGESLGSGFTDL